MKFDEIINVQTIQVYFREDNIKRQKNINISTNNETWFD